MSYADIYWDRMKKAYHCKICNDRMLIDKKDASGYEYVQDCFCRKIRQNILQTEDSGLYKDVNRYTFKSFDTSEKWQKDMYDTVIEYRDKSENEWLYVGGQSGSGKTHLCTALMGVYMKRGRQVLYIRWQETKSELMSCCNDFAEYKKRITPLKNAGVLYIDDLFLSPPSQAEIGRVFEIIDYRRANEKKTVVTSNRTISDLTQMSEQVAGRIMEMCGKYIITIPNDQRKNMRMKAREIK